MSRSSFLRSLAFVIALPLLWNSLRAQTPVPSASAIVSATPSSVPESTPEHKKHGFSAAFTTDDDVPADVRARLSPEQLFKIELARAERKPSSGALTSALPLLVPILVPATMFAMIFGIVAVTVRAQQRQRQLTHETIRQMVDKGQPIPPSLLSGTIHKKQRNDLRRGLLLCAIGLGISLYLWLDHDGDWSIGLIPLFIGAGYLIVWKVQGQNPPPQA